MARGWSWPWNVGELFALEKVWAVELVVGTNACDWDVAASAF